MSLLRTLERLVKRTLKSEPVREIERDVKRLSKALLSEAEDAAIADLAQRLHRKGRSHLIEAEAVTLLRKIGTRLNSATAEVPELLP